MAKVIPLKGEKVLCCLTNLFVPKTSDETVELTGTGKFVTWYLWRNELRAIGISVPPAPNKKCDFQAFLNSTLPNLEDDGTPKSQTEAFYNLLNRMQIDPQISKTLAACS
jgi:hypothetical protein